MRQTIICSDPKAWKIGTANFFVSPKIEDLVNSQIELFFLALPGTARLCGPITESGKKVIDLSADFRLNSPTTYGSFMENNIRHHHGWKVQYGLPELNKLSWEFRPDCISRVLSNQYHRSPAPLSGRPDW